MIKCLATQAHMRLSYLIAICHKPLRKWTCVKGMQMMRLLLACKVLVVFFLAFMHAACDCKGGKQQAVAVQRAVISIGKDREIQVQLDGNQFSQMTSVVSASFEVQSKSDVRKVGVTVEDPKGRIVYTAEQDVDPAILFSKDGYVLWRPNRDVNEEYSQEIMQNGAYTLRVWIVAGAPMVEGSPIKNYATPAFKMTRYLRRD